VMAAICSGTGATGSAAGAVEGASAGGVGEGASVTVRMLARTNQAEGEPNRTAQRANLGHSHTAP